MNTLQKVVAMAALCLFAAPKTRAQFQTTTEQERNVTKVQKSWFYTEDEKLNYRFTIDLDKGESLIIRFKKLSDWSSKQDFLNSFHSMQKVMAAYKDSIVPDQRTLCLDVHIPVHQKNIITRLNTYNEAGNLMTIDNDGASALKIGTDTLRILQNAANSTTGAQLQYTFLLKNLENYNAYAAAEDRMNKVADKIDSIVTAYRTKWKNADAPRHTVVMNYNPATNTTTKISTFKNSILLVEGGLGVSLVRNSLCPNINYALGTYLSHNERDYTFVLLSLSSFIRFAETSPDKYKPYSTSFVNLELGGGSSRRDPGNLFYKASMGIGYKLLNKKEEDRDPTMSKQMYRVFFSYSINKFFVITPEVVGNLKKKDDYNGWFGLSLNFRFF